MNYIDGYRSFYQFHDTTINKISIEVGAIIFYFENGVYSPHTNVKQSNKTSACEVKICVDNLDINKMYQHIIVRKIYKEKIKEIDFNVFLRLLEKNTFKIYLDYYSFFANSLLLKGFVGKFEIYLEITEVENIEFNFEL